MTDLMRPAQEMPLLNDSDIALDLTNQKIRAKALRDAVRQGDTDARKRVAERHPRAHAVDLDRFKLTDAQCVIAREAGLSSWPALKAHVASMDAARSAIEDNSPAPDGDLRTLHIRCGNDIEAGLKRAGFGGDFLMVADPLCQGPVSDGPETLQTRARFIASAYPGEAVADTLTKLEESEQALAKAADYERIALWFEHDPYDQLILIKILSRLKASGADHRKVELMSLHCFPGISKFFGIGQLSPAALRHMFAKREPVSRLAYSLAGQAWQALCDPAPLALHRLGGSQHPALPYLAGAVRRFLAELPGIGNGLSFTEEAALSLLKDGPQPWGTLFRRFMGEIDPLPFHGDLMFYGDLLRLTQEAEPLLRLVPQAEKPDWGRQPFALTATGLAVLEGQRDLKDCGPAERWNGGVRCFDGPDWRWDPAANAPVAVAGGPVAP